MGSVSDLVQLTHFPLPANSKHCTGIRETARVLPVVLEDSLALASSNLPPAFPGRSSLWTFLVDLPFLVSQGSAQAQRF